MTSNDNDLVISNLKDIGFEVSSNEDDIYLSNADIGSTFVYLQEESWIQIASILIDGEIVNESKYSSKLWEFMSLLHVRYIGCRFGCDNDNNIAVINDFYPEISNAEHISNAMYQMDYVGNVLLPLFYSVLDTGVIPSDSEIDRVFYEYSESKQSGSEHRFC